MKKIIVLLLALTFAGAGSIFPSAADAIHIRFATVGNEIHQTTIAAEYFKSKIEELSGGTITVTIFSHGVLGSEREAAEGVSLGTIGMTVVTTDGTLPAWVPDTQVLSIPFLFTNHEEVYYVLDNLLQNEFAPMFYEHGFIHLGFTELGFRHLTNNVREIRSAQDVAGLTIRVQEAPIWFAFTESIGALGTPIAFGELYTALQQGMVDGQENPVGTIYSSRFYEVQNFLTLNGHTYGAQSVLLNRDIYNSMTDEQKAWIHEAAAFTTENARRTVSAQVDRQLEYIRQHMTVTEDPDIQSFIDATAELHLREDVRALVNPELVERVLAMLGR